MKKYGIDIVDEWGDSSYRGIKYFDNIDNAIEWGNKITLGEYSDSFAFMVFCADTNDIVHHSFWPDKYEKVKNKILSRFEILDL